MAESNVSGPWQVEGEITGSSNATIAGTLAVTGAFTASSGLTLPAGSVVAASLDEEAGFEKPITLYAAATIAAGQPVYISGYSTAGGLEVALAYAARGYTAEFVAVTAATAADVTLTVAPVATITGTTSTSVAGTVLYLSTLAGSYSATVPSSGPLLQKIGAVTTIGSSDADGVIKMYPGYGNIEPSSIAV